MTVKELREQLAKYPDNMDVFMAERLTEFSYGLVNSVSKQEIGFGEDPEDEELARETVIVISEE